MRKATSQSSIPRLEASSAHYTFRWPLRAQTDAPDLLSAFRMVQDRAALIHAAHAQAAEDEELAEADMPAGFETLTD